MSLGSLPLGMSDKEFQRVAKRVPTIAECLQGAQARDGWPSLCALQTRLTITDAELKAGATNRYPYQEMPELVVAVIHQRVFEAFWNDSDTFPSRIVCDDVLN